MTAINFENAYKAYNCFYEAKTFTESALNNISKLINTPETYYSVIEVILSKTSKVDLADFRAKGMVKNAFLIYGISKQIKKAVNIFYEEQQLTNKIFEDSQKAIEKIYEATGYVSLAAGDIASEVKPYLVANFEEQTPFDLQTPNSSDYAVLSGEVHNPVSLIEVY